MTASEKMCEIAVYRVRVLFYDNLKEKVEDGLNYVQAKRRFLFYVSACLEFDNELHVRCVNIFRGKTCVKYYQNYSIYERRKCNVSQ